MANKIFGTVGDAAQGTPGAAGLARRVGLFAALLVCALAIFVFGSNYYPAFPTNGNSLYAAGLSAVIPDRRAGVQAQRALGQVLADRLRLLRGSRGQPGLLPAGRLQPRFAVRAWHSLESNPGYALGKVYDTLLVVVTILVLVKLSGADLGSLYLRKGNLRWGLGLGGLVLFNFATSALIFFATGYSNPALLGSAVLWGCVFAFSNGFLEELWLRGLFLKHLTPLLGFAGSILVTSL